MKCGGANLFIGLRIRPSDGLCEHGDESFSSIKSNVFHDLMRDYQPPKKYSVRWTELVNNNVVKIILFHYLS
jgi:hypothetical protein